MKIKFISCVLWMLLFISTLCFAQVEGFGEPPETISTFSGAQFYSRTLKSKGKEEAVQQWVFPLFATGLLTEDLRIRVYQTISTAQLKDGPSLSGLENTRIRSSFSLFENTVITYLGLSLPIAGVEPERETARLFNLLYSETLQFGVSRITEGANLDIGFAFAQPFEKLSVGFGAGYVLRGSYDRLSEEGNLVSYRPGDALSVTTGLHFRSGLTSLRGKILYIHYGDDTIDEENAFKNGDELSFLAAGTFRFEPFILTLFLADTIKAGSAAPQEVITINNLFKNRLNGGLSLAYPLLSETLILKTEARMKSFFDDDGVNAKVASFDGGFQLILRNNITIDVLASFINGDMDAGEKKISGFSLGLIGHYGF